VTIRYGANGQHTFYGHKILLATQSKFFENLFTKAPRVRNDGSGKELHVAIADIVQDTTEFSFKGDHPKTFKLMLKFAYGRELNYPTTGPLLDTVLFAIEMYRTATKYEFPEFEQVAVASFTVWMKKLCSGSSVESEGPTLHELFTVVVKVYAVPSNAHLRDGLIYVVTTTPQTCKFRTYKTFTFCVKAAADSEPGFEKDLR
jgi:hypothetical protein